MRTSKGKFPGWRTMTAAQRHNARQDAIWDAARDAAIRFNASSREEVKPTTYTAQDKLDDLSVAHQWRHDRD